MSFKPAQNPSFSLYQARRAQLVQTIKDQFKGKQGKIILLGAFEQEASRFKQESSFYYLTGLNEPGLVLILDLDGRSTLMIPNCVTTRAQWVHSIIPLEQKNAQIFGFDTIAYLGAECTGYQFYPFSPKAEYEQLVNYVQNIVANNQALFTLTPNNSDEYIQQRMQLLRFAEWIPNLLNACIDISSIIAHMRRKKDMDEIELLYKAVEITVLAQEAAAQAIKPGITEAEVQASLEYMMVASGAQPSFPSIVAGGKNGTVLHYMANSDMLKPDQLVIVDIGAEFAHYCADLTRTYPVSGRFTKRQKELYNLVLETQEYIASIAKPGMWLSNKEKPEQSLNHLAKKYLDERGYGSYFIHGIGHFLGLDVHDVGDYKRPLQEGDVITIEPGIYIPGEKIGIRIEDNYWIVKDGVVCLSEYLPKKAEEIEEFMQEGMNQEEQGSEQEPDEYDSEEDEDSSEDFAHG